jgi:TRAP-type C4-dicarboxylate transport system substrate-binding protein
MRIFSFAMVFALSACIAANAHALELKIATVSPDGSVWMKALREAAQQISDQTDGRVGFKFYPGGVMGDDNAVLRKMRVGQLHGAVMTVGALYQAAIDVQLYNLPMQFRSYAEVDYVRSRMDKHVIAALAEKGYAAFGIAEVGFAYAMSKTKLMTVEDVQSRKVWVPAGDAGAERTLAAFGVTPIPLSIADVLSGLQTGLINGVAVPPVAAIALQWHSQLEHVLDLPLLYIYGTFVVSNRQFNKVSDEDQVLVRTLMGGVARTVEARNRKDHERAVEALGMQGLSWNRPLETDVVRWQQYADKASDELVASGFISEPLFRELMQHLDDFRNKP